MEPRQKRFSSFFILAGMLLGCSVDSASHHYRLAEKLWNDKNYAASVLEFEKVVGKDPHGKLGQQALYRSAMTQYLFLSQYPEAVKKFRTFVEISDDPALRIEAMLQVGEILFSKMEQYDLAIKHYTQLLKTQSLAKEAPQFWFRIAKSQYFLFQFREALETYEKMIELFPSTPWAEKASFEKGLTYFTWGEREGESGFRHSIEAFESFMKTYPSSELITEARFWIASCYEETDHLPEAFQAFSRLKGIYPSEQIIQMKLSRIQKRLNRRGT
jgi:TolA-binding protein